MKHANLSSTAKGVLVVLGVVGAAGVGYSAIQSRRCKGKWLTKLPGKWSPTALRLDFPGQLTPEQISKLKAGDEVQLVLGNDLYPTQIVVSSATITQTPAGLLSIKPNCYRRTTSAEIQMPPGSVLNPEAAGWVTFFPKSFTGTVKLSDLRYTHHLPG